MSSSSADSNVEPKAPKTYKREVALGLFTTLAALVVAGVAFGHERSWEAAQFFTLPVFSWAAGAFGLDAIAKQWGREDASNL